MIKTAPTLFKPNVPTINKVTPNPEVLNQYPHWFELASGRLIFLPYQFRTKLIPPDRYVEVDDPDYDTFEGKTLSEWIEAGVIKGARFPYVKIVRNYSPNTKFISMKSLQRYFKKRGFNVTKEAIIHNFSCWHGSLKSGYRDEANGYHLFTPCGGNPLSFTLTSLHPTAADWQTTYEW